jgi:hypothetical protein
MCSTDTWQYEYTAGLSNPSLEEAKVYDGCSSQFDPPIEYIEPEEEVIYVTEKAYSYPHSSDGGSLHQIDEVSGDVVMEAVEGDTPSVEGAKSTAPTDNGAAEQSMLEENATTPEPKAKTRTLADRVRRDNKKEKGRGPAEWTSGSRMWIEPLAMKSLLQILLGKQVSL